MDRRISLLDLHDRYPNKSAPTAHRKRQVDKRDLSDYDIITLVRGKIIARAARREGGRGGRKRKLRENGRRQNNESAAKFCSTSQAGTFIRPRGAF